MKSDFTAVSEDYSSILKLFWATVNNPDKVVHCYTRRNTLHTRLVTWRMLASISAERSLL